jgi:hypothetical protein
MEILCIKKILNSRRWLNSTLQLFEPACLVYLLLDVWPLAKLADLFPKEGVKNPFLGK